MNVTRRSATRATCYFLRRSSEDDCGHAARRQTGNRCKKKGVRDLKLVIYLRHACVMSFCHLWLDSHSDSDEMLLWVEVVSSVAPPRVSTTTTNGIGKMRIKLSVISALRVRASWISIFCIWGRKQCVNCLTFVPELLRQFPDVKLSVIIIIALVI